MTKWIVVGAGLTGATLAERIATVRGEFVQVIERSPHVGGAAADYITEEGLLVSRCGPHVFHTDSKDTWEYVQSFAEWRLFRYQVDAYVHGQFVPLPIGFRGIDALFPNAAEVKKALATNFAEGQRVSVLELLRSTDPLLHEAACVIYDNVCSGYLRKHWGVQVDTLDPAVLGMLPVVIGDQDSYTGDSIQAFPVGGFTKMVARMLDHPLIKVQLHSDFDAKQPPSGYTVLYSGAIDEYFEYEQGHLPYRGICFDLRVFGQEKILPVPTVVYPNSLPYARATDMKQITGQVHAQSAVVYEYPTPYKSTMRPYYPVPTQYSRSLYESYTRRAQQSAIVFCGRLGAYKHYSMDQAVDAALDLFSRL